MPIIIDVQNLTKKFGSFAAVDSINLAIEEGELFGLLGPNGAGKTTTINMLSTIMRPTSGDAILDGHSISDQDSVRKSIGIVFQDPSLDDELTGYENLDFHGRLYHMSAAKRKSRIEEVANLIDLRDKIHLRVKAYSGGMKRRLEIARGLMHRPKILFLDEPTLGLDPQLRRHIWDYIKSLNKEENITVILTTHYMEEADHLCSRVGIIDHGKIIALDTPESLKNVMGGDVISLETSSANKLKGLLNFEWIKHMDIVGENLSITVSNGEKYIPQLLDIAKGAEIDVASVSLKKPTLEDVFIHYTGRSIRDKEASDVDLLRSHMSSFGWKR